MDWPTAFFGASIVVSFCSLIAWKLRLEHNILIEAIKNGYTDLNIH